MKMRTKLSGLLVAALIGLTTAGGGQALELCAKADRRGDPSQPKNGSPIRARSECKAGKEVSVGTTEGLADTAAVLSLVAENTAAIDLKADQTAVDDKADRQAVEANTTGISANAAADASQDTDIATNTTGVAANAAADASQDTDIATNTTGVAANAAADASQDTDIATNTIGVAANAAADASQDAAISSNAVAVATNTSAVDDKADRQAVEANTGRILRSEVACTVGECVRSCFITGVWFDNYNGIGGSALGEDVQGNFQFYPGGVSSGNPLITGTITGNSIEIIPGSTTCVGTISADCSEIAFPLTPECGLQFTPTSVLGQCGNGVVDAGEQCDDGNLVDGDGCDVVPSCTLSP
jgi:cysteine-rich repeat protein